MSPFGFDITERSSNSNEDRCLSQKIVFVAAFCLHFVLVELAFCLRFDLAALRVSFRVLACVSDRAVAFCVLKTLSTYVCMRVRMHV